VGANNMDMSVAPTEVAEMLIFQWFDCLLQIKTIRCIHIIEATSTN
jgi:hypothetical protein